MARFRVVLSAVGRAANRGNKSLRQVSGNNMFYAGVTLLFLMDPAAMGFFLVLIGIVIFLPSSGDPMTAMPRERLDLWPLSTPERYALRIASPLLNPLTWLMLGGMLWKRITWGLWAIVAGVFVSGFIASTYGMPNVWVPKIPVGRLTVLVRKDLRQLLSALDLYCGLLIAIPALIARLTGNLPEAAHVPLTGLMVIILSTMALTLFGLDGESGMDRYALWGLPRWKMLAAKGIAYMLLVVLLNLPFAIAGGFAGGLVALAVGQWVSIKQVVPQSRWRFRASSRFGYSLTQMLTSLLAFALVTQLGAIWLPVPILIYAASLWICGRA